MSYANGGSHSGRPDMATIARSVRSAHHNGAKNGTAASVSPSTATVLRGSATTADGQVAFGKLTDAAVAFAAGRGISRPTLERLGVASGTAFFPGRLNARSEAVFWPYHLDGEVANWKACAFPEKDFTCLLYTSDAADERSSVDLGGC